MSNNYMKKIDVDIILQGFGITKYKGRYVIDGTL